jgi:hypothetical protein
MKPRYKTLPDARDGLTREERVVTEMLARLRRVSGLHANGA